MELLWVTKVKKSLMPPITSPTR